ncbi:MAG: DUF547 domain-containing protein [Fibrobacterota bacterium]|nr:DUF547 domain-containing protein [Fibrobacterota bacterium]
MILPLFRSCLILLFTAILPCAAPESESWDRWKVHEASSRLRIDHGKWQCFLAKHLDTVAADGVNRVRYGRTSGTDRKGLESYLADLQSVKVSALDRKEQRAYWINLYNAKTIAIVLDRYPVKSIRDIDLSRGLLKNGPWDAKVLEVEGIKMSLNDVEHRILRPLWKDKRIHFALNCASLGCPNLASWAYTAKNTDSLLEKGARDFINSRHGARAEGMTLTLSSIFEWYREDFGKNEKELLDFLSNYAESPLKGMLRGHAGRIKYHYNWSLNDA